MKKILLLSSLFASVQLMAQPKTVSQAIVNTTTTITAPEGSDDVSQIQNQGDGRVMMRNFGDGETKSITYLKDDFSKTVIKTDMGRITTIRDNTAKKTTTLMEIMGNRTGVYQTDEEAAVMRHRMDSMMRARGDSGRSNRSATENQVDIIDAGETRKIAGYNAKKAWIITTRILGIKDTSVVWYTPEIKLNNINATGGTPFGNFGGSISGPIANLSKLEGFALRYETKMRNNRTMTVEVTKLELDKDIAAKEFEIPKDFDVKPMKDMQNGMRFGGGPGGPGERTIMIRQ